MTSLRDISFSSGEYLVRLARRAVETYLKHGTRIPIPEDAPEILYKPFGVFVTIEKFYRVGDRVYKELRGCIGYPEPVKPLIESTIEVAIAAAVEDPRFKPMSYNELDSVIFEVSILSKPELIIVDNPKDIPKQITIGRDGLIVERGIFKGLLLPQVPVEYGWDTKTFLAETCMKAGLPPDAWLLEGTKVYKFQALIFAEEEPRGRIIQRDLMKELKEKHKD